MFEASGPLHFGFMEKKSAFYWNNQMNPKMMIPFIVILLSACGGGGGGGGGSSSSSSSGGGSSSSSSSSGSSSSGSIAGSWDTPVRLSPTSVDAALDVSLAIDSAGNTMAVWHQYFFENGTTRAQVAASHLVSGQSWSMPVTIHGVDVRWAEFPEVEMDGNGNAFASWFHTETDPSNRGLIQVNRYVPSTGWGQAETLQEFPSLASIIPKLAVAPSGKAVAVWAEQNDDTVWACFYSAGAWCSAPDSLTIPVGTISAFSVEVAIDDSGKAMVVWEQRESSMDNLPDVMACQYNGTWSTPVRLEGTGPNMWAGLPKIGLDSAGNGIAVWQADAPAISDIKLYFNLYTSGGGWSEPQLLAAGWGSELAVSSNGNAVASWHEGDNLRAAIFSAASGWSVPVTISARIEDPKVAINGFGDAFAIWSQSDGIRFNIWANHYEAGTGWRGPRLVEQENSRSAHRPVIVIDNNNNAIAAWDYFSGAGNEVWASRYSPQ